jgi:hypothetical protein
MLEWHCNIIKPNLCYNNVFELIKDDEYMFEYNQYFICYGYWGIGDINLIRHAYLMNENEEIIDPSILITSKETKIIKGTYYTFAKLTYEEYMQILYNHFDNINDEIKPDLALYLKSKNKSFMIMQ